MIMNDHFQFLNFSLPTLYFFAFVNFRQVSLVLVKLGHDFWESCLSEVFVLMVSKVVKLKTQISFPPMTD